MGDISEWLKVMLEEIDRKDEESREQEASARDDKDKGVPARPGERGADADGKDGAKQNDG